MPINSQYNTNLSSTLNELFSNSHKPLCVSDIQLYLVEKNLHYNKTSIYRQIEKLISQQKISKITTMNGTAWELKKNPNHVHVICESCESISCATLPQEILSKVIQKISNFRINKLTINGMCNHCSTL
jgi:Fe2+ or Zn2+ uptake regulation protein